MTEEEQIKADLEKVVYIEALGNAGLQQSYEYIVSHVNTTNSQWVKRAGAHALRKYHTEHVCIPLTFKGTFPVDRLFFSNYREPLMETFWNYQTLHVT